MPSFDLIKSVVLYLSLFGLSLLLFATSERQLVIRDSASDTESIRVLLPHLASAVAILLLCLIAGCRADSVGVDTSVYPDKFMNAALMSSSFSTFLSNPNAPGNEFLGAVLVWFCSRLSTSKILLLFSYQLLTVVPVYMALIRLRNHVSITTGMAVYLFFFYNNSLNMMRQSIACAFLLLAVSCLLSDKKSKLGFFISSVIAILFHNSAIYGFGLLLLASIVGRLGKRSLRLVFYGLVILLPLLLSQIVTFLISAGIGGSKMQTYADIFVNHTYEKDWFVNPLGPISLAYLFMYSWLVFLPRAIEDLLPRMHSLTQPTATADGRLWYYFRTMNTVGYFIYVVLLVSLHTMYGIRFSIYFDFLLIPALGFAGRGLHSKSRQLIILASLISIWLIWVIVLGWSGSQIYLFYFE